MPLSNENRNRLIKVAGALGAELESVTFVGGAVLGLYLTEAGAKPTRATKDVDVVTREFGLVAPPDFERRLESLGFRHCSDPGAPVCRWTLDDLLVDVMHPDGKLHGFDSRWFRHVPEHRENVVVGSTVIHIPLSPVYVATKLEAYVARGAEDVLGSHDLEDVIAVIDARPALAAEIERFPDAELRRFVLTKLRDAVERSERLGYLEGLVEHGRLEIVRERCRALFSIA